MQKSIFTISLCFLILILLSPIESEHIYAQTEIPAGNVSGVWTKANSPYYINGEITIPNDSTLTIEPGVEVVFTGHYKFNVQGRLLAIGTETDTIVFTINDTTGFHNLTIPDGGWGGIRFMDTPSNNDSSKIVYCKLQSGKANTGGGYYDRLGGAICAKINKLLVSHCLFWKNSCYHTIIYNAAGGAMAIIGNPIIEFCEFRENTSTYGAAMVIWGSNLFPLIRNNYFHHNQGHGIIHIGSWNGSNTSPVLINNIVTNNIAIEDNTPDGHGIINFSSGGGAAVLINNTIVNNSCDISGSALCIHISTATPILINNIIHGNTPTQIRLNVTSDLDFYNCLIEGGKEGFSGSPFTGTYENCINVDPLFVSSTDFHLQDKSNCIGAAIDSVLIYSNMYHCPPTDFEGNPRPNPSGSMPDIGAYENVLENPVDIPEWINYNTSNSGLPSKYVYCIEIDEIGNKWIGTTEGLAKFDGINWTVYDTSNSDLPFDVIMCMSIDNIGNKWIISTDYDSYELSKFDGTNWEIIQTPLAPNWSTWYNCLSIDELGNKWIGTDEGLAKFDGTNWTVYNTANSQLPSNEIRCIAIDELGNKWIETGSKLAKFDGTNWTIYDVSSTVLPYYGAGSIAIDDNNNVWIKLLNYGLSKFNGNIWTIYPSPISGGEWDSYCVTIDELGNKWIGINAELLRLVDTTWTIYSNPFPNQVSISEIEIDESGNKWFGTWGGLCLFNEGGIVTELEQENISTKTPSSFVLYQNYPNPFNPNTTINYSIPKQSQVTIKVFDVLGSEVAALVNEEKSVGNYELTWNAANLPSGVYFYRIQTGSFIDTKKMILLR